MSRISSYGNVRSIQRGTIAIANPSTSNTATITSVDTAKSIVNNLGWTTSSGGSVDFARVALTNSTTVTANATPTSTVTTTVSYEVIEFY